MIAGSNTRVAWGNTNSYGDWSDAVVLKPGQAPDTYVAAGRELPFETHVETIGVNGGEPVEFIVRETIWGPVHDGAEYPGGEVAISWTAHHAEALNLNLVDLESAASVAEALDIANTMGGPPQNLVVGDSEGNIGWTIAGKIPMREGYEPFFAGRLEQWGGLARMARSDGLSAYSQSGVGPHLDREFSRRR